MIVFFNVPPYESKATKHPLWAEHVNTYVLWTGGKDLTIEMKLTQQHLTQSASAVLWSGYAEFSLSTTLEPHTEWRTLKNNQQK